MANVVQARGSIDIDYIAGTQVGGIGFVSEGWTGVVAANGGLSRRYCAAEGGGCRDEKRGG